MVWPEAYQTFGVDLFDALNGRLCVRRAMFMVQHLMRTQGTNTHAAIVLKDMSTSQWDLHSQLLLQVHNVVAGAVSGKDGVLTSPVSKAVDNLDQARTKSASWTAEDLVANVPMIPKSVLHQGVTRK